MERRLSRESEAILRELSEMSQSISRADSKFSVRDMLAIGAVVCMMAINYAQVNWNTGRIDKLEAKMEALQDRIWSQPAK